MDETRSTGLRYALSTDSGDTVGRALEGYRESLRSARTYAKILSLNGFLAPWILGDDAVDQTPLKLRLDMRGIEARD